MTALTLKLSRRDAELTRRVLSTLAAKEPEECERVLFLAEAEWAMGQGGIVALVRIANYIETVEKAEKAKSRGGQDMKFYTITNADVGQLVIQAFDWVWPVVDFMGRVLPTDVGKRVYLACGEGYAPFLQVENDDQRSRRLGGWPPCECSDPQCAPSVPQPAGQACHRTAVMHLFQVALMVHETPLVEGRPVNFCEPCGDNALQSGAWASGEDVAAARREAESEEGQ